MHFTEAELVKIILYTDQETRELFGVRSETVWATRRPDGRYKIDNIPFYSFEVCSDDIVDASPHNDGNIQHQIQGVPVLKLDGVFQSSGHITAQVLSVQARNHDLPILQDPSCKAILAFCEEIKATECTYEGDNTGAFYRIVIDLPPHPDRSHILARLAEGEIEKHWAYALSPNSRI